MAHYKNKFVDIDPETCTIEELEKTLQELQDLSGYYETKQLAIKTFLNSVYGSCASKYFVGYNVDVAESITLQGQDLNHYSENSVNKYFSGIFQSKEEFCHVIYVPVIDFIEKYAIANNMRIVTKSSDGQWVDVTLPEAFLKEYNDGTKEYSDVAKDSVKKIFIQTYFGPYLGIKYDDIKDFNIDFGRITKQKLLDNKEFPYLEGNTSMTIAGDTDSIYVEFGRITNYLQIYDVAKATRFIVDLWRYGCEPYMTQRYDDYAKQYNCDKNLEVLELEKIAQTALMTSKKHYAMAESFKEPNIYYEDLTENIIYAGLEIIQGSTATYAKKCMKDFVDYVVTWYNTNSVAPPFEDLYERICGYKNAMSSQSPEDICKLLRISDYDKGVLDDKNQLVFALGAANHVKAAGTANYFLNLEKNKKYRLKYSTIRTGDKVRVYPTTDPRFPDFAFLPGKYPIEYAPNIDYDEVFAKNILSLINTILEILGYKALTSDLCYTSALF